MKTGSGELPDPVVVFWLFVSLGVVGETQDVVYGHIIVQSQFN